MILGMITSSMAIRFKHSILLLAGKSVNQALLNKSDHIKCFDEYNTIVWLVKIIIPFTLFKILHDNKAI